MMVPLTLALALPIPSLEGLGAILVFLTMLSILVVLHEAGHFFVARRNGVRVNDFAVGFGPTLLKWTSPRSGTNYRLNLLPIGGYCAMQGEDGHTSEAEQQRAFRATDTPAQDGNFQSKTTWQRLAIVVAGPIANLVLAYAIFVIGAATFGVPWSGVTARIGPVVPNSPASAAGLQIGDEIVAIDGVRYTSGDAVVEKIHRSANVPLHLTYSRHGAETTIVITPHADVDNGKVVGRIGFRPMPVFRRVDPLKALVGRRAPDARSDGRSNRSAGRS